LQPPTTQEPTDADIISRIMGEPTPAPKPEPPKPSPKPRVQPEQFEIRLTKRLIALEDKIDALQGGANHESALISPSPEVRE